MVLNADVHYRILVGDLVAKLALVNAENDALKEQLAAAAPYLPKPKKTKPAPPPTPAGTP